MAVLRLWGFGATRSFKLFVAEGQDLLEHRFQQGHRDGIVNFAASSGFGSFCVRPLFLIQHISSTRAFSLVNLNCSQCEVGYVFMNYFRVSLIVIYHFIDVAAV